MSGMQNFYLYNFNEIFSQIYVENMTKIQIDGGIILFLQV
jgi:hypothetical protein